MDPDQELVVVDAAADLFSVHFVRSGDPMQRNLAGPGVAVLHPFCDLTRCDALRDAVSLRVWPQRAPN